MTAIRFDVLGPLLVRIEDDLIPLTGRKYRAVVSCLALNPDRTMSVAALSSAAWDPPAPKSAIHQVRKMVSTLRLSLDENWALVSTLQDGYRLAVTANQSDLVEFTQGYGPAISSAMQTPEELAQAYSLLSLWRGTPCEGSSPLGHETRIAELVDQHRALLQKTLRAYSELGRENELIALLQCAAKIHGAQIPPREVTLLSAESAESAASDRSAPPGATPNSDEIELSSYQGRCLPRRLRDFSGRQKEFKLLEDFRAEEHPGPAIATLHGMGGIGKTTLALAFAHAIADNFPDGQLFLDLAASTGSPEHQTRDSVGTLLRQLGVPDQAIPESAESRLALWRNQTSRKKILLILDDASDLVQIESLLPSARDAFCLVTSRIALGGIDGAFHLRLEVPTEEECLELLECILGYSLNSIQRKAAKALIHQFENLPLALRLAAARLTSREFTCITELAESVGSSVNPLDELDLPGRSLLQQLDSSLTSLEKFDLSRFLKLALLPAPEIDEPAVCAATGLSIEQARLICRRFTDRALLQRVAPGTYRMHSLMIQAAKAHISQLIPVVEQREVLQSIIEHYKKTVGVLGSARLSPSPGPNATIIYSTLSRAGELCDRLEIPESFAELCLAWEQPVSLYLDTEQQKTIWDLAIAAAHGHRNTSVRGNLLLALSRCLWHRDDVHRGADAAQQAWTEGKAAHDQLLIVRALLRSSSFCWLMNEVGQGLDYLDEAKSLLPACTAQAGAMRAGIEALEISSNEAALRLLAGEVTQASKLAQEVTEEPHCDPRIRIMSYITLAECQLQLNKPGPALQSGTIGLQEANRVRSAYGRALSLQIIAKILSTLPKTQDRAEAETAARQGRAAAQSTGSIRIVQELNGLLHELSARPDADH